MLRFLKRLPPGRLIALGFAAVILIGSLLLYLPCSVRDGTELRYIDALYTSASAVCVTGLATVDAGTTFSPLGQVFLALLIQVGGLGVTVIGAGIILAMGRRISLKDRMIVRESMNLVTGRGVVRLIKSVFQITLLVELAGAVLSYLVFSRNYPPLQAVWISLFHSIAAFNNAGFDILGNFQSLYAYRDNLLLNLTTCSLIILGGIGFLVLREIWQEKFRWKRFSLHTKVVLTVTGGLIAGGMLLLRFTENIPWLGALFYSVSARTAGFSSYPLSSFSHAGLFLLIVLMVIGASPGSTGGGIKTTTFFTLLQGIKASASGTSEEAYHYTLPVGVFRKAAVITLIALGVIAGGTFGMLIMEPELPFLDLLFEAASAFGTVGLSTGITPGLCAGSKLLSIAMMYIGRIGPLTIASLWYFTTGERTRYPAGSISIG